MGKGNFLVKGVLPRKGMCASLDGGQSATLADGAGAARIGKHHRDFR
jgi:hypothetical protein